MTLLWHHRVEEMLGDDSRRSRGARALDAGTHAPQDIARHGRLHRHRPHAQYRAVSTASSRCTAATSSSRAAATAMPPRPACRVCLRPATSPITSIARRSLRPARLHGGAGCGPLPRAVRSRRVGATAHYGVSSARSSIATTQLRCARSAASRSRRGVECARGRLSVPAARIPGRARAQRLRQPAQRLDAAAPGAVRRARAGGRGAAVSQGSTPGASSCSTWPGRAPPSSAGCAYYPKLLCAVPFTPATGPRLLCRADLRPRRCSARCCGAMRARVRQRRASPRCMRCFSMSPRAPPASRPAGCCGATAISSGTTAAIAISTTFSTTFSAEKRKKAKRERRRVQRAGHRVRRRCTATSSTPPTLERIYALARATPSCATAIIRT